MQAWQVHQNGEPGEVMRLEEVEPADARRGPGAAEGACREHQLPGRADVPRPVPGAAAAAVHARRGDLRRDRGRPPGDRQPRAAVRRFRRVRRRGRRRAAARARGAGRRRGRRPAHRLPDRLVRPAPPGAPARPARRCSSTPPRAGSAARPCSSARRPAPRVIGVVGGAGEGAPSPAELGCDVVIDRRARGRRRRGEGGHRRPRRRRRSTTRSAARPTPSPPSASPSRAGSWSSASRAAPSPAPPSTTPW